jgi:Ser-tRNA(Ala) deacylase AlaX
VSNIFLSQPDTLSIETRVAKHRILEDGRPAIVAAENPLRPAGGGQPADYGLVVSDRGDISVNEVLKADGETWLALSHGAFDVGDRIQVSVNPRRRRLLSQCHTLTHLAMAVARELVPGYESKGADISEDGTDIELRFLSEQPLTDELVEAIDRRTRSGIAQALPITIERARSIANAAGSYPKWRIDPGLNLSGRIRIIVIEGMDANPCSGSHVGSTAEIGPYAMLGHSADKSGRNILRLKKLECWTYWY